MKKLTITATSTNGGSVDSYSPTVKTLQKIDGDITFEALYNLYARKRYGMHCRFVHDPKLPEGMGVILERTGISAGGGNVLRTQGYRLMMSIAYNGRLVETDNELCQAFEDMGIDPIARALGVRTKCAQADNATAKA